MTCDYCRGGVGGGRFAQCSQCHGVFDPAVQRWPDQPPNPELKAQLEAAQAQIQQLQQPLSASERQRIEDKELLDAAFARVYHGTPEDEEIIRNAPDDSAISLWGQITVST